MSVAEEQKSAVVQSAGTVSGWTAISRVLGLARDIVMTALLGASWAHDVFAYAWTLPNAFRRLFGEGALGTAFIPVFTKSLESDGEERAAGVARQTISNLGAALAGLVGVFILVALVLPPKALGEAAGFSRPEQADLLLWLVITLLPYLVVVCVLAQFMGVLNALGRFDVPAISPVILNVVWLGAAGLAFVTVDDPAGQVRFIAGGILLGAALQFFWHLPALSAVGVPFRFVRPTWTPEMRQVMKMMGPMVLGMGAVQVNILVDRTVALVLLPEGGTTHLYYAMRLMQLPLALISISLATAVYPVLARLMAQDDPKGMAETASLSLRTHLLVALPAATGLMVLAKPIISLLFERGAFTASSTAITGEALAGYAVGLPFLGMAILLQRACYASGDPWLPVRIAWPMVIMNVVLDLVLVGPYGALGLAIASSLAAMGTAALLLIVLRRRLFASVGIAAIGPMGGLLAMTLILGVTVTFLDMWLVWNPAWVRVAAGVLAGLCIFGLLAPRFCREEWQRVRALFPLRQ
ncbi:MAG: murein biosynthesis integral membrane protein MurJ [Planctomycetota bacterium]|nr:murein biosynthesis integral membrane protein MurJ [Planctomycetota bacterium]